MGAAWGIPEAAAVLMAIAFADFAGFMGCQPSLRPYVPSTALLANSPPKAPTASCHIKLVLRSLARTCSPRSVLGMGRGVKFLCCQLGYLQECDEGHREEGALGAVGQRGGHFREQHAGQHHVEGHLAQHWSCVI